MKYILIRFLSWCWRLLNVSLFLILLSLVAIRLVIALLPVFQEHAIQFISDHLKVSLQVEALNAEWHGGLPTLTLKGLKLQGVNEAKPGLKVDSVNLELNFRSSLWRLTPVFNYLTINGALVELVQKDDGSWRLLGIDSVSTDRHLDQQSTLLDWLRLQGALDISDTTLSAVRSNGDLFSLHNPSFSLVNDGGMKRLEAQLELGGGELSISGQGAGATENSMDWKGTITVRQVDIAQVLSILSGKDSQLQQSSIAANMSWHYNSGKWQITGDCQIPEMVYLTQSGKRHDMSSRARFFMDGVKGKSWSLWLEDFYLALDQQQPILGNWYLAGKRAPEYTVSIASKRLDIIPVKKALIALELLSDRLTEVLSTLDPRGQINDFVMQLFVARTQFDFDLSAQLQNISVDAWKGAPSAANITGAVRMSRLQGHLDVDSQQFSLGFPRIFENAWDYDSAHFRLYWGVADNTYTLKSDRIDLRGREGKLTGRLKLDIPLARQPLSMALAVGLDKGDAIHAKKYIPARLSGFSETLTAWLDSAIKQANIDEGGFLYNGFLQKKEKSSDARWGLFFKVSDADFDYHHDWPKVTSMSGDIYVNNDQVGVDTKKGSILDAKLQNTHVKVPLKQNTTVFVRSRAVADGDTLQRILTETPLNNLMKGEVKKWRMSGRLAALLRLQIPIADTEHSIVNIAGKLEKFFIDLPEYKASISDISGDIAFSSKAGLTAKALKGMLFEQPIVGSISSTHESGQLNSTKLQWLGSTDIHTIMDKLEIITDLSMVTGQSDYSAELIINHLQHEAVLEVDSNLQGLYIDLPKPLFKKADRQIPLKLKYIAQVGRSNLAISLEGLGKAEINWNAEHVMKHVSIALGPKIKADSNVSANASTKLVITGFVPELDIAPWYDNFKNKSTDSNVRSFLQQLTIDDVKITKFSYDSLKLDNVSIAFNPISEFLRLAVNSDAVAGSLLIPERTSQPYQIDFEHIVLPKGATNLFDVEKGGKSDISPLSIPAADVSIKSMTIGALHDGALAFNLRPMPDGVKVESLQGQIPNITLTGSVDWVERGKQQQTYFQGLLELEEDGVEQFQQYFDFPSFFQAKKSKLITRLNWSGSPRDAQFPAISGSLDLDLTDGKLKKLDRSSDALKLFGILNSESFARRLKLDFSDLYSSGISFDKIKGSLRFKQGLVTFDAPVELKGPSSNFKLDGLIDTQFNEIDASVVVTLPVTSNLPIFSVLLGAAPQVAGIIYIADKLVGSKVDQLASIRYRIDGSLDKPNVTLERFFSDKVKKSNATKNTKKTKK